MATPEYTAVNLSINDKGTKERTIKFSDLEDTLNTRSWLKLKNLIITDIPSYRDPEFEYSVCKFVFNKVEIYEKEAQNKEYEYLIYGQGSLL